jgi:hypothetical protein
MEHMQLIEDCLRKDESAEEALKILLSISTDPKSLEMLSQCKGILTQLISLASEDNFQIGRSVLESTL